MWAAYWALRGSHAADEPVRIEALVAYLGATGLGSLFEAWLPLVQAMDSGFGAWRARQLDEQRAAKGG